MLQTKQYITSKTFKACSFLTLAMYTKYVAAFSDIPNYITDAL